MRRLIPSFLSLAFLALTGAHAWAEAPLGKLYAIQAERGNDRINCNASLLSFDTGCVLVTNAHCTFPEVPTVKLRIPHRTTGDLDSLGDYQVYSPWSEWFPAGDQEVVHEVRVLKRSPELDLAQLEIPQGQKRDPCWGLTPVEVQTLSHTISPRRMQAAAAVGYLQGKPTLHYSDELDWNKGYGSSMFSLFQLGLDPAATMIRMTDLRIIPGMSGGLVVSNWRELIGLIARFVPLQKTGFAIPMSTVFGFVNDSPSLKELVLPSPNRQKDPPISAALLFQDNRTWTVGANSQLPGGGNSHADGGGNSHADGGGNSHADGGNKPDARFQLKNPLDLFREPNEGIPDPQNPQKIILGFQSSSGSEQIDGTEDYQIKLGAGKPANATLITRDTNGYPAADIRKQILSRLEGAYRWRRTGARLLFNEGNDNRHLLYQPNAQMAEGWEAIAEGSMITYIDVSAKKSLIRVSLFQHSLELESMRLISVPVLQRIIDFHVTMSDDAKTLKLTSDFNGMTCDNRHFLKLVCTGDGLELSLSLSSTRDPILNYRLTGLTPVNGKPTINYYFGELNGTDDPMWGDE